jgi:hypothetical protein
LVSYACDGKDVIFQELKPVVDVAVQDDISLAAKHDVPLQYIPQTNRKKSFMFMAKKFA